MAIIAKMLKIYFKFVTIVEKERCLWKQNEAGKSW